MSESKIAVGTARLRRKRVKNTKEPEVKLTDPKPATPKDLNNVPYVSYTGLDKDNVKDTKPKLMRRLPPNPLIIEHGSRLQKKSK